jgi:addiction module RelB/DinJ family antitoxin
VKNGHKILQMYAKCLQAAKICDILQPDKHKEVFPMANTATVYARIDPELKSDVDSILNKLGVTPSALIQMLYSQIKLTESIPFEIKIPAKIPLSLGSMSVERLNTELQKGVDSVKAGRVHSADEVDGILNKEFGI